MGVYVEAPELARFETSEETALFLAGGITGCPNWQEPLGKSLAERNDNLVVMNPRQAAFDVNRKDAAKEQIRWEFEHLNIADIVLFWFPKDGVNVITLFELGVHMPKLRKRKVFVAYEPGFWREDDVVIQTGLHNPEIEVGTSLEFLEEQVNNYMDAY